MTPDIGGYQVSELLGEYEKKMNFLLKGFKNKLFIPDVSPFEKVKHLLKNFKWQSTFAN